MTGWGACITAVMMMIMVTVTTRRALCMACSNASGTEWVDGEDDGWLPLVIVIKVMESAICESRRAICESPHDCLSSLTRLNGDPAAAM
jgi:hypothetical protein